MVFFNDKELCCARNTKIRIDPFVLAWIVIEAVGKAKGLLTNAKSFVHDVVAWFSKQLTSASALRSQGFGFNSEAHSSSTHRFHVWRDELESSYFCSDEVVSSRFLAGWTRDELESSYFCSDEVMSCRFLAGRTRELEISRLTNSGVPKCLRNS